MLLNLITGEILEKPQKLKHESLKDLDINFINYKFYIPKTIKTNKKRLNYKVNFLVEMYAIVFPSMKKSEIYKNLNYNFDVFLSDRQIQRIIKNKIEF